MPWKSAAYFFAGVFCLFGALVLIGSCMNPRDQSAAEMISDIFIGGGFALGWAYCGTRRIIWGFWILGPVEAVVFSIQANIVGPRHILEGPELAHKLTRNGYVEIALLIGAYVLFLLFFNREGSRFFRTQTEVRLAGEIHHALVPQRQLTIGNVEIFGVSVPSSEVGGDLVDVVETPGGWHAYVADVSGHGVAAGILMAMIKSTANMQLTKLHRPHELLADINDVMQPLTATAKYLTFAYLGGAGDDTMKFALAGHLPILHYSAKNKSITEHDDQNVPLGLLPDRSFTMGELRAEAGDLLAILTDGFTEVFDRQEQEFGMERFKRHLLACAEQPLEEIYRELRTATMAFGEQSDDQTLLLVRRLA